MRAGTLIDAYRRACRGRETDYIGNIQASLS